jgi:hypothetical protein
MEWRGGKRRGGGGESLGPAFWRKKAMKTIHFTRTKNLTSYMASSAPIKPTDIHIKSYS